MSMTKHDINALTPGDFLCHPFDSVTQHTESEIVAHNIMVICKRRGDRWGELTRDEYDAEREKDGGLSAAELREFDEIYPRINRVLGAITFSPTWLTAAEAAIDAAIAKAEPASETK